MQEEPGNASLPACPVARTGKGRHLWFRSPARYKLENGVKRLPGLDVRTVGGYVVVPPSVHASGTLYAWAPGPAFDRGAIPEAPARLLEALAAERGGGFVLELTDVEPQRPPEAHRLEALLDEMRKAREGERNSKLHWVARRLVETEQEGRLPTDVWTRLRGAARSTGLGEPEIDKTIASARRGAAAASSAPGGSGAVPIAPPWPAPPPMSPCGWPDPEPLRPPGSTPRLYPIAVPPEPIREAVTAYQRFGEQPVALVATSALAAASLACQVHVDVERLPGLSGPISLYLLTIAQSGERKSSADAHFKRPFHEWIKEREADLERRRTELVAAGAFPSDPAQLRQDITQLRKERARFERKLVKPKCAERAPSAGTEGAERSERPPGATETDASPPPQGHERRGSRARKGTESVENLTRELSKIDDLLSKKQEALALLTERVLRLFLEDATPEAPARALDRGRLGMGLWSDEGGLVVGSHAMSEESVMRFLGLLDKLWDGRPFTVDRVTQESFEIRGRRLTLNLMLQPDVAKTLLSGHNGLARGIGFLARCLVAWPESTIGSRLIAEEEPGFDDKRELDPPVLRFAPDAQKAWIAFHNQVEGSIGRPGAFGEVPDIGAKIAEQAARIAGVFHVFERGLEGEIDRETTVRACELARWHLAEALRVCGDLEKSQKTEDAELLLDWLRRHPGASLRDISQREPSRLRKKERRDRALDMLVRRNLCRINGSKIELSPRLVEIEPSSASIPGGEPGPDVPF